MAGQGVSFRLARLGPYPAWSQHGRGGQSGAGHPTAGPDILLLVNTTAGHDIILVVKRTKQSSYCWRGHYANRKDDKMVLLKIVFDINLALKQLAMKFVW